VHDFFGVALSLLTAAPSGAPNPGTPVGSSATDSHEIILAVLILVGTIVTAAATVLVATIQRDRGPRSTVPANDRLTDRLVRDLTREKDEAEKALGALKTACWRRHLDPDQMIQEVMATP
jgi:hypothetical protein